MEEIGACQCAQRKSDEKQIEKQGGHYEEGEQPEQGDGEHHRSEGEQEQCRRKLPRRQLFCGRRLYQCRHVLYQEVSGIGWLRGYILRACFVYPANRSAWLVQECSCRPL